MLSFDTAQDALLRPLPIPDTTPQCYISFMNALNLRFPDEDTGDWHFFSAFFAPTDRPLKIASILLAGAGQVVDSNPALGQLGIRDMASVLSQQGILVKVSKPVYVANHFRAIADIALFELLNSHLPQIAHNDAINAWLDNPEQIHSLKSLYLQPLASILVGQSLSLFDQWFSTIQFA